MIGKKAKRPSSKTDTAERKRRTREHIIADLSVNFVERMVLKAGYVAFGFGKLLNAANLRNPGRVHGPHALPCPAA